MKSIFLLISLLSTFTSVLASPLPDAPLLAAKAYLLYDYTSNQILVSQDSDKHIAPASLTKLMTAYLTFSALKLNQISLGQSTLPTAEALRSQEVESRMFLDKNKAVTIAELLRGLIALSGNDAARVLATVIAGSEESFVEMMNNLVRKVDKSGAISTVAGTSKSGFSGDEGPAREATFNKPHSIALDGKGSLFICDIGNHRVRRVDLKSGLVTTLTGTGEKVVPKDGSSFVNAPVSGPRALDFGPHEELVLALREGNSVYRLDLAQRSRLRCAEHVPVAWRAASVSHFPSGCRRHSDST